MMSCVRTNLRGWSQTVGNSHLCSSNPTLNQLTNQPIKHDLCARRKLRMTEEGEQSQNAVRQIFSIENR